MHPTAGHSLRLIERRFWTPRRNLEYAFECLHGRGIPTHVWLRRRRSRLLRETQRGRVPPTRRRGIINERAAACFQSLPGTNWAVDLSYARAATNASIYAGDEGSYGADLRSPAEAGRMDFGGFALSRSASTT